MDFLRLLANYRTEWLTFFFSAFTFLGEEVFAISIICFLYWCHDKRLARAICLVYFTSGLIVQSLKITFRIPRPWVLDSNFQPVTSMIDSATGYSFPSGHTQSSSSLFGSFLFLSNKLWQRIFFSFSIIGVGFSRMYLGYHTPKDVLTSMCISLFLAFLFNNIVKPFDYDIKKTAFFIAAFSSAILVYALLLKNLPDADITQFHDCFKAAGAGLGLALGWYIEPTYIRFDTKSASPLYQSLKLFLGLFLAILLKLALRLILGSGFTADVIRYFILVCWIMILYPSLFSKLGNANSQSK